MSPRETVVLRSIALALEQPRHTVPMDAFASSYQVPANYHDLSTRQRAAALLRALAESKS